MKVEMNKCDSQSLVFFHFFLNFRRARIPQRIPKHRTL